MRWLVFNPRTVPIESVSSVWFANCFYSFQRTLRSRRLVTSTLSGSDVLRQHQRYANYYLMEIIYSCETADILRPDFTEARSNSGRGPGFFGFRNPKIVETASESGFTGNSRKHRGTMNLQRERRHLYRGRPRPLIPNCRRRWRWRSSISRSWQWLSTEWRSYLRTWQR